ncbi:ankyrin repeat and btb poz domain containing protein [Grosmannia clavigera kw1407]|uniref:Ankyrin repeat and btb poz domain containing protein n=1 Tax=Grosmannia clavigera (strain kw1407 / UAMH 11150) TaxID=655863 RepID=F0XT94_GROCL|nr:ankyrin repeat and btb poz domain containing protein [Grosmannia clavigera kw1407]EFW99280.1 ankyrin repeat and btb poz domain containing protein [Grosmannia clavigera kw1407]
MAMVKGQLEAKLKEEHELISSGVLREENPLDLSDDFAIFLEACRRGDLGQCQKSISTGVNINGKDEFDYTPLIIASLCGHYEVVQLLLESGALAERNTFQGERCLYNALNDRIRNLLLRYDYAKSTDPLQPWASHITSLLTLDRPPTSDITLTTAGTGTGTGTGTEAATFRLHRFLLAARSPYFRRKLSETPEFDTWRLSKQVPAAAFGLVLRYLYLDDVTAHATALADADVDADLVRGIDRASRYLEVDQLWEAILASHDRRLARQRYQDEVERAQHQIGTFFRQHVLGNRIVVDAAKVDAVCWPPDNHIFADCLLQADEEPAESVDPEGEEEEHDSLGQTSLHIPVGPAEATSHENPPRRRAILYPAHKALLVRCDYFQTMFSSAFREAQPSPHLRIIPVDCAPDVLEIVLAFLYTEQADIPLDRALDVLYVADMLFLDRLKTKAAMIISTLGSGRRNVLDDPTRSGRAADDSDINVYDVLRAAWDLRVQRLEEFAARFLAQRLEHYIDDPAFADFVLESANRLRSRQETDSIELVDDIRYFLSERFRLRFEELALVEAEADGEPAADGEPVADATIAADTAAGVMRTLDGHVVEDEFDSDQLNYQILLTKIDSLLERLGLDG